MTARKILLEIEGGAETVPAIRRNPLQAGGYVAKHVLVAAYHQMVAGGVMKADESLLARIRMKPIRTLSGVATVTVLTKPYPCPGDCIFCPTDNRMPKSYLPDEPGAARAYQNEFDPFLQVRSRLDSYHGIGHPTGKIELLILGGTWSAYRRDYQEWFVKRCFDAMNGAETESTSLEEAHRKNEESLHRNVGLVIETRPDKITVKELVWLRRLGVTKVQLGVQRLDDAILEKNRRGHSAASTLQATALLRAAGFKVVAHWMPNLLGASLDSDRADFARLWKEAGEGFGCCPDELKIYPTQLLENAELYDFWQCGEYQPYTTEELIDLIADLKPAIPPYCRVNRVIRDIPSTHVVDGNKRTSLRQDVLAELAKRGQACRCVRCREIRARQVRPERLKMDDYVYQAAFAEEHFLSFVTPEDRIAGYLRLSLPKPSPASSWLPGLGLPDLQDAALIREVHIYGQAMAVGAGKAGVAQHSGLGERLLDRAAEIAREDGFRRLAVISAIGTRRYYKKRGFVAGDLYLTKDL
ncbi:MAG: tRNA uridine(34) 5-carboxymethylaminomethyl modification radical SAM/GNAT enzyme Elp3 [Anaerolineaceae bacterium]|nr:tRNA uridine(34) 5-carboxymethylaminomethyl modification radical SAM/GNAT enzyme Elp3 [Anaerolineaceae bacterium]